MKTELWYVLGGAAILFPVMAFETGFGKGTFIPLGVAIAILWVIRYTNWFEGYEEEKGG